MWPKLLIVQNENFPDYHFLITSSEELEKISEKIIRYRLSYDFYCCDGDVNDAYTAFENEACWKFLRTRSKHGYEYERVELKEFNNESCLINKL